VSRIANPWINLPDGPPWLLPQDRSAVARWQATGTVRLDLIPEPFLGGPEGAAVVLLMRAPGVADADEAAHGESQVQQAIRRSHRAEPGYFHPFEPEMEGTPAETYWRRFLR
jgi:hypothetical protein